MKCLNKCHLTCLHFAVKKGYFDMTQLLVEKGADVNATDSMERTPLFYALINQNKSLIKVHLYTFYSELRLFISPFPFFRLLM